MHDYLLMVDEMLCQPYTFPITIYLKLLSQEFIKRIIAIVWCWVLKDIYLETAALVTKVGSDARRYRELGKKIVLGLNNGQFPSAIYEDLAGKGFNYDLEDVQYFVGLYYNRFPEIRSWREKTVLSALERGNVSTKLGRFRKLSDNDGVDSICNHPVQGTGADGFKMALVDLDRQLVGQDAQIIHILHDEIIVEARKDIVGDLVAVVKDYMERAFGEIFPEVPFVVTPEIRDTWGVMSLNSCR